MNKNFLCLRGTTKLTLRCKQKFINSVSGLEREIAAGFTNISWIESIPAAFLAFKL